MSKLPKVFQDGAVLAWCYPSSRSCAGQCGVRMLHCPYHGYPSHGYYCYSHPLLSFPDSLFLFLPLIFLLLWDAYCLSYFSPAVLNWSLRKAMPSIITHRCWFSLTERNGCCWGGSGLDDRRLDICYGCSLQIHEQEKISCLVFFFILSWRCTGTLRIRNLNQADWNTVLSHSEGRMLLPMMWDAPLLPDVLPLKTPAAAEYLYTFHGGEQARLYVFDITKEALK